MKILYVIPDGIDLGGIITVTEQYLRGLIDIGHDVMFARLTYNSTNTPTAIAKRKDFPQDGWTVGEGSGLPVHPVLGWAGPQYGLRSRTGLDQFLELAASVDLVIWGVLYGLNATGKEEVDVLRLFKDHGTPQITILHDDHLWERQAWVPALPNLVGVACVHRCSFDLAAGIPQNRALIFNAHDIQSIKPNYTAHKRSPSFFSVQTAKPWKKVDRFVGAAAYVDHPMTLAGEGIELRYMRSKDKCKPQYFHRGGPFDGQKIWDVATARPNFTFAGPVSEARRDQLIDKHAYLCDFSHRQNTGQFNRVFVEAAKRGVVTIANTKFMCGHSGDDLGFMRPYGHFISIDSTTSFRDVGHQLDLIAADKVRAMHYKAIVENNYELLKLFDRELIAEQLVQLSKSKKTGYRWAPGEQDDDKMARAHRSLKETFK